MTCLQCTSLVSRNAAMTKNGYSGCRQHPDHDFRAMTKERECAGFARVSDEIAETRNEWAEKK